MTSDIVTHVKLFTHLSLPITYSLYSVAIGPQYIYVVGFAGASGWPNVTNSYKGGASDAVIAVFSRDGI